MAATTHPHRRSRAALHPLRSGSARYLVTHRSLLWRTTRNELQARYAGSHLGRIWVLLAPLLLLVVYSVTYVAIFHTKIAGLTTWEYVFFIFSGLVPYLMAAEALANGVVAVLSNKSVLNNTVFPIDLTPVKSVLVAQATMIVGLVVTVIGSALVGDLHWTVVFLPVIWTLQMLGLIGIVWFISLLNILFRDIQNFLTPVLMIILIISPYAYTPDSVPTSLRLLIYLNPFAYFVVAYQQVLVLGLSPGPLHWVALLLLGIVPFLAGSWFFATAKRVIIDYV
ncbi:MAG: ABC transporter permease [Actinobacteria bacterium]|nr:ABC transporter permease [Actinomycetota bacterium]